MFEQHFSYESLLNTYNIAKKGKLSTGRDQINKTTFSKKYKVVLEKASEKIINGTYKPTPYKEVLIVKNRSANPRCLSIQPFEIILLLTLLK